MRVLLLVILLSGCSASPYVKLSGGHILSQREDFDYRITDGQTESVNNPCDASFRAEIGLEKRVAEHIVIGAAYSHNSNIDCGWPRDDYNEYYKKSVEVSVKVGGIN